MPVCAICGEVLPEGTRTCSTCGTSFSDAALPTASIVTAPSETTDLVLPMPTVPPDGRYCPACGDVYGSDYSDAFCACGVELVQATSAPPVAEFAPPAAPSVFRAPMRPAPGTPCLALYNADKKPLQFFALTRDATVIGRLDAVAGVFPDVDLDEWLDPALARKVSRQHAMIVRQRGQRTFALRPLAGNTGTQLETEMVLPLHDYPLQPGQRMILGGVVRLKFEIA